MEPRTASVAQGLPMKVSEQAQALGDLAREHLEEKDVVGRSQRVAVAQRELELRRVVLRVHRLERNLRLGARRPDRVDQTEGIDGATGAVDEGAGRVHRLPAGRRRAQRRTPPARCPRTVRSPARASRRSPRTSAARGETEKGAPSRSRSATTTRVLRLPARSKVGHCRTSRQSRAVPRSSGSPSSRGSSTRS